MMWKNKHSTRKKDLSFGDKKWATKFAWLPVIIQDNKVWFQNYSAEIQLNKEDDNWYYTGRKSIHT